MKRWESLHRLKVGLDFGHGKASCQIGETAIAEGRVYLQFDSAFVSKNMALFALCRHQPAMAALRQARGVEDWSPAR